MRAPVWLFGVMVAGCSFTHGESSTSGDAMAIDPDAPGCKSFSSQLDTCAFAGSDDLTLAGQSTYDTTTGVLAPAASFMRMNAVGLAGPIEVVLVRNFRMTQNARLRADGDLPLAIIAYGTITIEAGATIDVSAGGAGARATCVSGALAGAPQTGGAGGGGGGGFGAAGGTGGPGDSDAQTQAAGGTGGLAATTPLGPIGGCPGAAGGVGEDPGGPGGAGGGAIYLASAMRVDLAATAGINAGGGHGSGGRREMFSYGDAGGGGGGAGGMIMFESPIVRSAGVLAANGGAGGEGSGGNASGNDGNDGALATTPAAGGFGGSSSGADGGNGGAQLAPAGVSVLTVLAGGGGGGGGGVGFIIVKSADAMVAIASPAGR